MVLGRFLSKFPLSFNKKFTKYLAGKKFFIEKIIFEYNHTVKVISEVFLNDFFLDLAVTRFSALYQKVVRLADDQFLDILQFGNAVGIKLWAKILNLEVSIFIKLFVQENSFMIAELVLFVVLLSALLAVH